MNFELERVRDQLVCFVTRGHGHSGSWQGGERDQLVCFVTRGHTHSQRDSWQREREMYVIIDGLGSEVGCARRERERKRPVSLFRNQRS